MTTKHARQRALVLTLVAVLSVACAGGGARPMQDRAKLGDGSTEQVVDGSVSSFIVDAGAGNVVLVDATMNPSATAILAALEQRGASADSVAAIFFTHGHGDHIAGAIAFPKADIYVLEADQRLVEGHEGSGNWLDIAREPKPTGITVTRPLSDGEVIEIGDLRVEVFAVPGHTDGSAAFLARGVLFLGDSAAATVDGELTAAPPIVSADLAANRDSLRKLAERLGPRASEIRVLAFAHQGPLEGPQPLFDWAHAAE